VKGARTPVLTTERPCVVDGHIFGAQLRRSTCADVAAAEALLAQAALTVAGLRDPALDLWVLCDAGGAVVGTAALEHSGSGEDVLVRSVALVPGLRGRGLGEALARHALVQARRAGARRVWLFSSRAGSFWQRLGFHRSSVSALTAVLRAAPQVVAFGDSGQLPHKMVWQRPL
jgi:N-acetylglutamate synthase-like GNAT family acetyltransferase